jgi:hypothetical protein
METNYQLFYRDNGRIEKMQLQAISKDMAEKFFTLLRPDCEIIHITSDPIPMTVEYVENLMNANLLN